MFSFGRSRRTRLSGILASLIQIMAGALFVNKFFKGEPHWLGFTITFVMLLFIGLSVIIEPSDKPDKKGE